MSIQEFIKKLRGLSDTKKIIIIVVVVGIATVIMGYFWVKSTADNISKIGESVKSMDLPKIDIPDIQANLPSAIPVPNPSPENQTTDSSAKALATADWKTYTSDKYGFEIKYPKEYFSKEYINEQDYLLGVVFSSQTKSETGGVLNPYLSVSVYNQPSSLEDWLKKHGIDTWNRNNDFMVDDQKALHLTNNTEVGEGVASIVIIFHWDKMFRLENFDKDGFDGFVSTFKFTN